tara:strand:- start:138 stop:515 length:378 start_codon:yes stop_codon:yes gene_type:complete
MQRDFTYISDVVEAIYRLCSKGAIADKNFKKLKPNPSTSFAPHMIFNIGNGHPINLLDFIEKLEFHLGKKAKKVFLPMQLGDVQKTFADTSLLNKWINYKPSVSIDEGLKIFSNWYKGFLKVNIH